MGTQGTKGDTMTKVSGRKAHSNGAQFEDYLERVIFAEALRSGYFARVDKQNPTYFAAQRPRLRFHFTRRNDQ